MTTVTDTTHNYTDLQKKIQFQRIQSFRQDVKGVIKRVDVC